MAEKEPSTSLIQDPLFETVGSTQKIDSPTSVWTMDVKVLMFRSTPMRFVFGAGIGFCVAFCVALYLSAQSQPGAVQNLKTRIDIGQELVSVGQEMTEDGPPLAGEEIPRGLALRKPTLVKVTSAAGTDIAVSKSGNVTVTNMDDFFAKMQRGKWSPPSVEEFRTGVISRESLPPFPTRIGPKQISPMLSEVISKEQGILNLEKSGAAHSRLGAVIMFLGFLFILGDWAGLSLPVSLSTGGGFLVFSLICSCIGGFIGASFIRPPSN